jgi:CRISPR-associated protein Cas2
MPTETAKQVKAAASFRRTIMKDGFNMFQFSAYLRHCPSMENAEVHIKRVEAMVPEKANVGILLITDKQFGSMRICYGKAKVKPKPTGSQQLEMF